MTYLIEKNVPLPRKSYKRAEKYPFAKLKIGDSFAVPGRSLKSMSSTAHGAGKRHRMKFAVRGNSRNSRVWRIA